MNFAIGCGCGGSGRAGEASRCEDCVKDRLAAYFHWDDTESLRQAILVTREAEVDVDEVRRWADDEGQAGKFSEYFRMI